MMQRCTRIHCLLQMSKRLPRVLQKASEAAEQGRGILRHAADFLGDF